ncbi:hypothetical protein EHLJMEHL_01716 [Vreelandella titanicae]
MKKIALSFFILALPMAVYAGVKYMDKFDGGYAITCDNGDRSGIVEVRGNGMVCASSSSKNAKCDTWSVHRAAEYLCR